MAALDVILHNDGLVRTPAAGLIGMAQANLMSQPQLPQDARVLYATIGDSPVGVLCYQSLGALSEVEWQVLLAYTEPSCRERVLPLLWDGLVERAKMFGVRFITTMIHPDDHDTHKMLTSDLGALLTGMQFELAIA